MIRWHLENRVAVVTGAANGLGAALCRRLITAGCRVGALDIDAAGLERLGQELQKNGATFAWEVCDLADEVAVHECISALRQQLGPIEIAIANAGITHLCHFKSGESAAVRRVCGVNFFGAVHLTDACFDDLVAHGGLVAAVSSVAGYGPLKGRTAYAASKHALHGFFDTLRCELRSSGVGVLLICPSFIATGIRGESAPSSMKVQPIGQEDSPDVVAKQIVGAISERRRFLATGRVGRWARRIHRLSPRLFEALMLRRTALQ